MSRNPRKTNNLQHVRIKKGHSSHLTPASPHFLSLLHSTHSKGSSSLCWSANTPQGSPSPFTQLEGRKFFLVLNRMDPILSKRPNRSSLIHSTNICCVYTMWGQCLRSSRDLSMINTLRQTPPWKQFHSLCHFGFSAQKSFSPFKVYCPARAGLA